MTCDESICDESTSSAAVVRRPRRDCRRALGVGASAVFLRPPLFAAGFFATGVYSSSFSSFSSTFDTFDTFDGVGVTLLNSSSSEGSSITKLFRAAARRDGLLFAIEAMLGYL